MDDNERHAIRDEGHDPDDPHTAAALQQVTAALREHRHLRHGYPWWHIAPELNEPAPPIPIFDIEHTFP